MKVRIKQYKVSGITTPPQLKFPTHGFSHSNSTLITPYLRYPPTTPLFIFLNQYFSQTIAFLRNYLSKQISNFIPRCLRISIQESISQRYSCLFSLISYHGDSEKDELKENVVQICMCALRRATIHVFPNDLEDNINQIGPYQHLLDVKILN